MNNLSPGESGPKMPSEGRREIFRRSCGLTQEARECCRPATGDFARCGVRGRAAFGGGGELLPGGSWGFAKGGTGHPDLRPGFLYPLLRLPLTFRSAALPFGHAAKVRGTQLKPLYHLWRTAAVSGWLRA